METERRRGEDETLQWPRTNLRDISNTCAANVDPAPDPTLLGV